MARYSLALCAAAVLIYENEYGDRAASANDNWNLHTGDLGDLGAAYSLYEKVNNIPEDRIAKHPLDRNAAVRNSIGATKDGQEMFHICGYLNYPGISNAWGRVFRLNDDWQSFWANAQKRAATSDLSAREQKLLECLIQLDQLA